ncbi:MAG TPA: ABC transporter substrate-binding protein, partial [Acidimicrobiia bacterium]|nr:ABC transporter substrate-binding protein [Acidimicrobiia bacterium]
MGGGPAAAPTVPTPGNPDAPDVGITAKSIKVGHVGIYSGPVGEFGQDLSEGGLAALQYWNDNGGVNGRKLNIIIEDDSWESAKGMAKVRKLVEQDQVFALVATQSVPTTNAAAPYLDEKKVP